MMSNFELKQLDSRDLQLLDYALTYYRQHNHENACSGVREHNEDRLWTMHERVLEMLLNRNRVRHTESA